MNKTFIFLIASLFTFSALQAQVSLTKETHGFVPQVKHQSVEVQYAEPGEAGANLVWDFSDLAVFNEDGNVFSEIEAVDANGIINVTRNDGMVFHYRITDSGNDYIGYSSEKTKLTYTTPILKTQYPQSLGTSFKGDFAGQIEYSANASRTTPLKGTYSTHADASGILILPGNIELDVLRVHTTERIEYSNIVQVTDKYLWYAQDIRYPVLVSMETYIEQKNGKAGCSNTKSYMNTNLEKTSSDAPTQVDAIAANDIAYSVSPNPFQDMVEVNYFLPETMNVTIALYTSMGVKVADLVAGEKQSGHVRLTENIASYTQSQDMYVLKLTFGDKTYSEKLIKAAK